MLHLFTEAAPVFAYTGHHMDFDRGGWFWMMIMMIVGVILVALVVYLLVRALSQGQMIYKTADQESPLDIAKRRYAAGEISREDFERIKNDLKGGP